MICRCMLQAVVELLIRYQADVTAASVERQCPLHVVAANNSLNSFYSLLRFIEDINVTDRARRTALHHAAFNGHSQVYLCYY